MRHRSFFALRTATAITTLLACALHADVVVDNSPAATHGTAGSHTVSGSGTTLTVTPGTDADANGVTDDLLVGLNSTGSLTITNGASVSVPSTSSPDFTSGTYLGVTTGSTGSLTVSAGGSLATLGLVVGGRPDATGSLLVTGTGSSVTLNPGGWGLWLASPTSTTTITNGASLTSAANGMENGVNAGSLTVSAGGSLTTGYSYYDEGNSNGYFYLDTTGMAGTYDYLGLTAPATLSATMLVTGSGSVWNNTGGTYLNGNSADTVSLTITDHAALNHFGSISIGTASTLTVSAGATATLAVAAANPATITIEGGTLALESSATLTGAASISVGANGVAGTLNVSSGASLTTQSLNVGYGSDGFYINEGSVLLLTGAGSTISVTGTGSGKTDLYGSITITDGGALHTAGLVNFASSATISAGGSLTSTYGGSLSNIVKDAVTVTGSGSSLALAQNLRIYDSGGLANLTIADHATFTSTSSLTIGYSSSGSFNVTSGATASTAGATIGFGSSISTAYSGHATVTGSGSVWNNTGNLSLASRRPADLTISAGGVLNNTGNVTLGALSTVTGSALVTGSGSQLNVTSGTLTVGGSAPTGQLTIADHGLVTAANTIINDGDRLTLGSFGTLDTTSLIVNPGGTVLAHDAAVFAFDLGAPSLTAPLAFGASSFFTADSGATIYLLLNPATGFGAGTYSLFSFDPTTTLSGITAPTFQVATGFSGFSYAVDLDSSALRLVVTESPLTGAYSVSGLTEAIAAPAVPEPATYALIFGLAILGVVVLHRRRP